MSCDFISDFIAPFVAPKWRIHTRIGEPLQSLGHLVTCNLLVSCTTYPLRTRSNNNRGKFKDTSPIGISSFQAQAYKHPKDSQMALPHQCPTKETAREIRKNFHLVHLQSFAILQQSKNIVVVLCFAGPTTQTSKQ